MKKNSTNINGSKTLTKHDCGLVFLNGKSTSNASLSDEATITLPSAETGLHYKFILNASMATSSASFVITTLDNASFVGSINATNSITAKNKKFNYIGVMQPGRYKIINGKLTNINNKRWTNLTASNLVFSIELIISNKS